MTDSPKTTTALTRSLLEEGPKRSCLIESQKRRDLLAIAGWLVGMFAFGWTAATICFLKMGLLHHA